MIAEAAFLFASGTTPANCAGTRQPWTFYLEGRYEHDSNVFQNPQSAAIVQTGASDWSSNALFFAERRLSVLPSARLRFLGLYQGYRKLTDLDLAGGSLGLEHSQAKRSRRTWLRYDAQYFFLGRQPYLFMPNVAVGVDLVPASPWLLKGSGSAAYKKFVSAFRNFDGVRYGAALSAERPFNSARLTTKVRAEGFRDQVQLAAFRAWGAQVAVEFKARLPAGLELSLAPEFQTQVYDASSDTSQPRRRDQLQRYPAALSCFFASHWSIELALSRIVNRSTDGRFSYEKTLTSAGLSYAL